MIKNGNLIRLLLNGTLVAKLTAFDVNFEAEMLDKTNKDSNSWKEFQQGNKGFTMSCEGFVYDPFDTNMAQFSEDFLNALWVINGAGTKSAALFAAPDGFIKANQFEDMDALGGGFQQTTYNSAPSTTYTYSIYLKIPGGTMSGTLKLGDTDSEATEVIAVTGSWARYDVSYTSTTGGSPLVITLENNELSGATAQTFGAQLELGSAATPYEPTGINFNLLYSGWDAGTKFTALVTDQTTGEMEWEGDVIISNLARTTPQGQLQTFSCDLQGTAEVTPNTI